MQDFLKYSNILYEKQFGFHRKHSTSYATAYLALEIYSTLDKVEKSICVFMDLSKALDDLNLNILIDKLSHYGIRGVANKWFSSHLYDRSQFVPQGSILGPLLFNLYINESIH